MATTGIIIIIISIMRICSSLSSTTTGLTGRIADTAMPTLRRSIRIRSIIAITIMMSITMMRVQQQQGAVLRRPLPFRRPLAPQQLWLWQADPDRRLQRQYLVAAGRRRVLHQHQHLELAQRQGLRQLCRPPLVVHRHMAEPVLRDRMLLLPLLPA